MASARVPRALPARLGSQPFEYIAPVSTNQSCPPQNRLLWYGHDKHLYCSRPTTRTRVIATGTPAWPNLREIPTTRRRCRQSRARDSGIRFTRYERRIRTQIPLSTARFTLHASATFRKRLYLVIAKTDDKLNWKRTAGRAYTVFNILIKKNVCQKKKTVKRNDVYSNSYDTHQPVGYYIRVQSDRLKCSKPYARTYMCVCVGMLSSRGYKYNMHVSVAPIPTHFVRHVTRLYRRFGGRKVRSTCTRCYSDGGATAVSWCIAVCAANEKER